MGIRTVGFEKVSTLSPGERKPQEQNTNKSAEEDSGNPASSSGSEATEPTQPASPAPPPVVTPVTTEPEQLPLNSISPSGSPPPRRAIIKSSIVSRSPVKLKASSSAAMARLGGMKVAAARKLKKHRKRSLFVHSANKILRTSINSNKNRRVARVAEEKPRESPIVVPSRISTRTCLRRVSREGIPEAPLRTVELIKRPLELREPATKLLYMASLGLYPRTGESDMTPIVVIKELTGSPGKKNGTRKSMELPLIPFHKRYNDLTNQDKRSISENIKPVGKQPSKRDSRKSSPVSDNDTKPAGSTLNSKFVEKNMKPSTPIATNHINVPAVIIKKESVSNDLSKQTTSSTLPFSGVHFNNIVHPVSPAVTSAITAVLNSNPTTTITTAKSPFMAQQQSHESADKNTSSSSSNPKSLLRNNLIASSSSLINQQLTPRLAQNLSSIAAAKTISESRNAFANVAQHAGVPNALNLIMSNITIIPRSTIGPINVNSRKRAASPSGGSSDLKSLTMGNLSLILAAAQANNTGGEVRIKPPKKRQRIRNGLELEVQPSKSLLAKPVSSIGANPMTSQSNNNNLTLQQPLSTQVVEEALNLCVKGRVSEQKTLLNSNNNNAKLPPPKLHSSLNQQKQAASTTAIGPKALNLIIPRPPPLTKAPLEVANGPNPSPSQNFQPPPPSSKSKPKSVNKSRKASSSINSTTTTTTVKPQPPPPPTPTFTNPPVQPILPQTPQQQPVVLPPETTVHAKSLLKCMNGEENTCVREVGESLDSVKTMLARLQTRIGPAVNGVRLITIE